MKEAISFRCGCENGLARPPNIESWNGFQGHCHVLCDLNWRSLLDTGAKDRQVPSHGIQ